MKKDITCDTVKMRIESVYESQRRTRLALFVCVVVCLSVIIVYWNTHLSWYKRLSFDENFSSHPVTQEIQKDSIAAWVDSHTIGPLFGIRIGADDIPTLGSLSLLIITAWLYSCVKRDNQTIGLLLIDSKDRSHAVRSLVIHGVTSRLILTLNGELEPIRDLEHQPTAGDGKLLALMINKIPFFLPAIAMGFVLVMEIVSTFLLRSVFTDGVTIFDYWMSHGDYHARMYQYLGYMSICLAFTVVTVVMILRINDLQKCTLRVLDQFIKLSAEPAGPRAS